MEKHSILIPNPRFGVLPKTGQQVSYADYDDGYYEQGWKKGRTVANNRTRFVKKAACSNVILDYATRLMWSPVDMTCGTTKNWADSLTEVHQQCNLLPYYGFLDWRMPNILELASLLNFEDPYEGFVYSDFFANMDSYVYWSSTTRQDSTTYAHVVRFLGTNTITSTLKTGTGTCRIRVCRSF